MARTSAPVKDRFPLADPVQKVSQDLAISPEASQKRRIPAFWRHFLEMLPAMAGGVFFTSFIFVSVVGLKSWAEGTSEYPTQALLAMAAGMTVPMVAWMLFRG